MHFLATRPIKHVAGVRHLHVMIRGGLLEGVPVPLREAGLDDLQGLFQPKPFYGSLYWHFVARFLEAGGLQGCLL